MAYAKTRGLASGWRLDRAEAGGAASGWLNSGGAALDGGTVFHPLQQFCCHRESKQRVGTCHGLMKRVTAHLPEPLLLGLVSFWINFPLGGVCILEKVLLAKQQIFRRAMQDCTMYNKLQ